jgi:hypothetical protein
MNKRMSVAVAAAAACSTGHEQNQALSDHIFHLMASLASFMF